MKKNILLVLSILLFLNNLSFSQYISPGNGNTFTLDDLVNISGGVVTLDGADYIFNDHITISPTDTLTIFENGVLYIHANVLVTIQGVLLTNPPDVFDIKKIDMETNYLGFRFEASPASVLKGISFYEAGGIKLVNSDMGIIACSFTDFGTQQTSSAINAYHSSPLIRDCTFTNNTGSAIASGANAESSPQIIHNTIHYNVTGNTNTPQINLGSANAFTSILIDSNQIIGQYEMAGGIALSTLAGGGINATITNNEISYNRYGIAQIGDNISSVISHNTIVSNNIQDEPMQGGSGLNFYGGNSNTAIVSYNIIAQNLWGITIQSSAQPNFGDNTDNSLGHNRIEQNANNGQIYALYNNTPGDISALNNYWGTEELSTAEDYIFHTVDDANLGLVSFDPMWTNPVGLTDHLTSEDVSISPNPATKNFVIHGLTESSTYKVYTLNGKLITQGSLNPKKNKIDVDRWKSGCYFIRLELNNTVITKKIIIQ
ncbi:MAG: T9SS type A sorting domain-containing protein [Bacteroidales bacterium]|nr:T9SS type A sorting domain-containing protein [Bacteroidales bacterium]